MSDSEVLCPLHDIDYVYEHRDFIFSYTISTIRAPKMNPELAQGVTHGSQEAILHPIPEKRCNPLRYRAEFTPKNLLQPPEQPLYKRTGVI